MNAPFDSLFVIVMLSSVLLAVTAAAILLALRYKKYHSHPYLIASVFFLLQSLGIAGIIAIALLHGKVDAPFDTILRPGTLITGFTTIIFFLAYIANLKNPGIQNSKKLLLSISPFIIVSVLLIISRPSQLHSLEELFDGIERPDVLLRLIIIFFYFAYPIVLLFQKYEWHQCLVSRKTIVVLHILSILIVPPFIAGMMCGYFPAIVINYIIAIIMDILVAYIEFKIRIPVSGTPQEPKPTEKAEEAILGSAEIWKNPDMTASELVRIMGTNHTYLLKKIKSMGYASYSDMINRKRVEFICKGLKKGGDVNIIDLMFESGFRSRSTASREFKRIVGCTPSEYQESRGAAD